MVLLVIWFGAIVQDEQPVSRIVLYTVVGVMGRVARAFKS